MIETIIEVLVDCSGSMGLEKKCLLPDGSTRMSLLKKLLLEEILPTIDYSSRIFIRTFNSIKEKAIVNLSYEGVFDRTTLESKIRRLPDAPTGGTPITAAVNAAVNSLRRFPEADRKIILLTDGEENGGGDYKKAAENALAISGIPCKIFIIGIAQGTEAENKARQLSHLTQGLYINLPNKAYDAVQLKQELEPLKKVVLQDTLTHMKAANPVIPGKPTIAPVTQTSRTSKASIETQENNRPVSSASEALKQKIVDLNKQAPASNAFASLSQLEDKVKQQIEASQQLLLELSSIKENLRVNALLELGIDATTLTIDNEYSDSLRQKSESFLYTVLCEKHGSTKVNWMNATGESYKSYDFEILDDTGAVVQFVECKGTAGEKPTFYLSVNEWTYFLANKHMYQVYRIFGVEIEMKAYCIENLLQALLDQKVVPYLLKPEVLKEDRVFLTVLR